MAEGLEVDEAYYEEVAKRAYGRDCEIARKLGVLDEADWAEVEHESRHMSPEEAVYFLRRIYYRALKDASDLDTNLADVEAGAVSAFHAFSKSRFDADRWHNYCLRVDVSPLLMRERLARYLQDGQRVADVGCGTGLSSLPLLLERFPKTSVVGFDGSTAMMGRFRNDAHMVYRAGSRVDVGYVNLEEVASAVYLSGYRDDFDQVVANGVLYFVRNVSQVFEFVARILKKGAYFHFSLPLRSGGINELILPDGRVINRESYLMSGELVYHYGREQLLALAAENGMTLVEEETQFVHREDGKRNDVNFTFFTLQKA